MNTQRYTKYWNYYLAAKQLGDRQRIANFCLATDEYMFEGIEPQWEEGAQEWFLWQMILPSLQVSKRQKENGLKAAKKGPRPSMLGNQNARKIRKDDIIATWNDVAETPIRYLTKDDWEMLQAAWPEIGSLDTLRNIIEKAHKRRIPKIDAFAYLFNDENKRYRDHLPPATIA